MMTECLRVVSVSSGPNVPMIQSVSSLSLRGQTGSDCWHGTRSRYYETLTCGLHQVFSFSHCHPKVLKSSHITLSNAKLSWIMSIRVRLSHLRLSHFMSIRVRMSPFSSSCTEHSRVLLCHVELRQVGSSHVNLSQVKSSQEELSWVWLSCVMSIRVMSCRVPPGEGYIRVKSSQVELIHVSSSQVKCLPFKLNWAWLRLVVSHWVTPGWLESTCVRKSWVKHGWVVSLQLESLQVESFHASLRHVESLQVKLSQALSSLC